MGILNKRNQLRFINEPSFKPPKAGNATGLAVHNIPDKVEAVKRDIEKPPVITVDRSKYIAPIVLPVSVGNADQIVLPQAVSTRTYLMIINLDQANTVYVNFGGAAATARSVPLPPGGAWEFNIQIPQTEVRLFSPNGASDVVITYAESNIDVGG